MSILKSLIGRRQFLVAAGVTSSTALASRKLSGYFDPFFKPGHAEASEGSGTADKNGGFSNKYSHILSPVRIGNVVLKNRMMFANAIPKRHQGPETFPAWEYRNYVANLAKNGAGTIILFLPESAGGSGHEAIFNIEDKQVQNYIDQMSEGVHCYGSKLIYVLQAPRSVSAGGAPGGIPGAGGSAGMSGTGSPGVAPGAGGAGGMPGAGGPGAAPGAGSASGGMPGAGGGGGMPAGGGAPGAGMSGAGSPGRGAGPGGASSIMTSEQIETMVKKAQFVQLHGFDGVYTSAHASSIELYKAIKKACGQDFLIVGDISAKDSSSGIGSGFTAEGAVPFLKQCEGLIDILQIRIGSMNLNHPTGFTQKKGDYLSLPFAEAVKKAGLKMLIAPNGGFQDLDFNEDCIASGKCDMICMGRAFICDFEYARKAYEGRGEDVVPCIMCNKCHGISKTKNWYSACSVNPVWGISAASRLLEAPAMSRKVAVIGGGPAGMKAALVLVERGHKVTIYEKNEFLGGQLKHADFGSFSWPLKNYRDYLIRQVKKAGIEVLLNTKATPEMIKNKAYDAVLVAVGADPVIPDIPGAKGGNVRTPITVFGGEKNLGKNVVVIGGGDILDEDIVIGVGSGIYLAESGHNVTYLTSRRETVPTFTQHYPEYIVALYQKLKNITPVTEVVVTGISEGKVTYKDAKGNEKSVQADSVVVSVGRLARREEALKFYGSAPRVINLGDCSDEGGNIQRSTRSAYFAASQI